MHVCSRFGYKFSAVVVVGTEPYVWVWDIGCGLLRGKIARLPCGCAYEDYGFLLVRLKECGLHRKRRTRKRAYRPKAESAKP